MFSRQGLGGHMSRAHPGKSDDYKKKKATRDKRSGTLKLLRSSQNIYRKRFNCPNIETTAMNRTQLNKIRAEIQEYMEKNPGKTHPEDI